MPVPSTQPVKKFVRAGAGAGKTWNLTRQVIEMAMNHRANYGQWPKTVLTTFTKKATQELKERMLIYCLEEKPEALEYVQSTSFLQITTMHGLLSRFLSQHGYALGLPNQLKVVDKKQADFWRKQILRNMVADFKDSQALQHFDFNKILSHLSDFESVYWSNSVRTLESPDDFEKVMSRLLLPFEELLGRLIIEARSQEPGVKWEEYFSHLAKLQETLKKTQPWSERQLVLNSFFPLPRKPRASKDNPGLDKEIKDQLDKTLTEVKKFSTEEEFSSEYWPKTMDILKDFNGFARKFMRKLIEKKKEEGALEPNDLEYFSLKILLEKPQIFSQFSKDIDAWFIDEFQDTSPLQMQLLEPMIGDQFCYLVGDPQQSIYLFRGSRSEVFFKKAAEMKATAAEMLHLQKNYRSEKPLLNFFNAFFPSINESFSPMEATIEKTAENSAVEVSHVVTEDSEGEVYHLTQQLIQLIRDGVSPKDICILTRTHAHTDRLQKKLMGLGYPVISHSSSNFYKRREILDGLSLLKFLINPWDDKNLLLIFRSPWIAMSDEEIVSIIGDEKKNFWTLFRLEFEKYPEDSPQRILLNSLNAIKTHGYAWTFRRLVIQLGLLDYSYKLDTTGRREANLWKLINIIEKNARESGSSLIQLVTQGTLSSSLEDFGDAGDASSPVEPNKIHLMTVHASKGLQYDYVFLPFLHKKPNDTKFKDFTFHQDLNLWTMRMPLSDATKHQGGALESLFVREMKKREKEESNRVFYVGVTRAKKKVFLSWSGKPESHSWAEILMDHKSQWDRLESVQFSEVTGASAVAFNAEPVTKNVKGHFSDKIKRFSTREDVILEEDRTENWTTLKEGHIKRREGVVLHKIFESLKTHSVDEVKTLSQFWLPEREQEVTSAIDYLFSIDDVPLREIIENGKVEWGYAKISNGKKEEKRIDLWGIADGKLWVVDYKTGSTQFKDKAFMQMADYGRALITHLNWDKAVKLVAIYPFAKQLFQKEL